MEGRKVSEERSEWYHDETSGICEDWGSSALMDGSSDCQACSSVGLV